MSHDIFILLYASCTHTHTHLMPQTFFSLSVFKWKLFFFSNENFCVSPFSTQPTSASVNCVNSYKIYTMFNNNFPFKLNFSKWNRISHWLDHHARAFFFCYRKIPCVFFSLSRTLFFVCVFVIPNCLASFLFHSRNAEKYFYELFKIAYSSCGQWPFFSGEKYSICIWNDVEQVQKKKQLPSYFAFDYYGT